MQITARNLFMVTPPLAHTMHGMCCVSHSVVAGLLINPVPVKPALIKSLFGAR